MVVLELVKKNCSNLRHARMIDLIAEFEDCGMYFDVLDLLTKCCCSGPIDTGRRRRFAKAHLFNRVDL